MSKLIKTMFVAIICGVMFTNCGGSSAPKSNLKQSDVFGNLPALYDEDEMARKEEKERMSKVTSVKEAKKEAEKQEKAQEKRKLAIEAEKAKLADKEVPFTLTDAQKASGEYSVSSVKVVSLGSFSVTIVPSKVETDLIGTSSLPINFRYIAKDGSTLQERKDVRIYGGKDKTIEFGINLQTDKEKMVDFASIEFFAAGEAK